LFADDGKACEAYHDRIMVKMGKAIVGLTVRDILNEQIVLKLA